MEGQVLMSPKHSLVCSLLINGINKTWQGEYVLRDYTGEEEETNYYKTILST